jgi:SHS2 domain-containing protein
MSNRMGASPRDGPESCGRWEHFPHQADIGVRGIAPTLEGAFAEAARALTAVICALDTVAPSRAVEIDCSAPDQALLLAEWLNAIVYEMAVRHMLFSRFEVEIAGPALHATAWGEAIVPARHRPAVEVKGATYTELRVARQGGGWMAQCVVDV